MSLLGVVQSKPAPYSEATVSSTVTVTPINNPRGAFTGTVVANDPEGGRLGAPTLMVLVPGEQDARLVVDNGLTRLSIDKAADYELVGIRPLTAVSLVPKKQEILATAFTGGIESAAALVKWTAGTGTTLQYKQATDVDPEHLEMFTGNGQGRLYKGDRLVLVGTRFSIMNAEEIADRYEEAE